VTSKKSILQKEERMQARKDPYRIREKEIEHLYSYVCMYVCLTDIFHHCKEKNNNMSTTKTRKKKKRKGQQVKLAIPNVQKNMSTSLERDRERKKKIEFLYCLKENR
jgi:hypothetical protein